MTKPTKPEENLHPITHPLLPMDIQSLAPAFNEQALNEFFKLSYIQATQRLCRGGNFV